MLAPPGLGMGGYGVWRRCPQYIESLARPQTPGKSSGSFRVVSDSYVTNDSGTGIVHQAPAFGEDDYRVCIKHGIIKKGEEVRTPRRSGSRLRVWE